MTPLILIDDVLAFRTRRLAGFFCVIFFFNLEWIKSVGLRLL